LKAAVGDFSASWLALREPADHAARSGRLTTAVVDALRGGDLRILDLGSGTGSNVRYLAPRLPRPQQWLLVDNDRELLSLARQQRDAEVAIETCDLDLNTIYRESTLSLFDRRHLVTASALLDLVSERWVEELARLCQQTGAAALFVLTYDGRIEWAPHDDEDETLRRLVNEHQRRDKGLGPALGPDAPAIAARAFAGRGYRIERDRSDWVLAPEARALQRQLIDGWSEAALAIAPALSRSIAAWRARRVARIDGHESTIRVGHQDLLASIK
jgi:SAM-dependent methyltransferase